MINRLRITYGSSGDIKNCYLYCTRDPDNCVINNSIIYYGANLSSSIIVNNCIGSGYSNMFKYVQGGKNSYIEDLSSIFESYNSEVDDVATYKLTAEAKSQYIGNDGTEIGLYGGMIPFSSTPSSPQISKFKIAEKSTADGKLSIDITIDMPE